MKQTLIFRIKAARRATSTTREIVIFSDRGRTQDNIDKKGHRIFPTSRPNTFRTFRNRKLEVRCFRQTLYAGPGLSKQLRIIRFKNVSFGNPKCSKTNLQTEFWNIFYTILNYLEPCVSLGSSKLYVKVEIQRK